MGEIAQALITAVIGGLVVSLLGNRRLRYEHLYEERARVFIWPLLERIEVVDQRFHSLVSPAEGGSWTMEDFCLAKDSELPISCRFAPRLRAINSIR